MHGHEGGCLHWQIKADRMGRRKRKTQHRGHYCWSCDRYRVNERFCGRGHARHLCHDCARLGQEELAYRQHVRNIQRCLTYDGRVRRKRRRFIEQFLGHEDLRLRAWAVALLTGIPVGADDDDFIDEQNELLDDDAIVFLNGPFQRSFIGRFTDAPYNAIREERK